LQPGLEKKVGEKKERAKPFAPFHWTLIEIETEREREREKKKEYY